MATRSGIDQHEAELRGVVAGIGDECAAHTLPIALGDPASLRLLIKVLDELRDDARTQCFEVSAPSVFLCVICA